MRIVIGNKAGLKGRRMGPSPVIAARARAELLRRDREYAEEQEKKAVAIMKMSAT